MTVHFSNLQYNLLRHFENQPKMSIDDFAKFDQRITSGLGRRNHPIIARVGAETVGLTHEGREALRLMSETNVYRNISRDTIAQCFARVNRRASLQISQRNIHKSQAAA